MKQPKIYPKFLKCDEIINTWSWNKHLLKPWTVGELVKVADESEQHSNPLVGSSDEKFREQYVVVYRKDENGRFTIKNVGEWRQFDKINKK